MKLCKETMIQAYNWTSFSPEKRGESDYKYYTELLADDLKTLGENTGNYERKYIQRVMMIYHRKARTASPMIAGPAKFPFRSNSKKIDSERRAEEEFTRWRNKYIKAATRERTLSPEEEIDKTLAEIDGLEALLAAIKEANKKKTKEERLAIMVEHGQQSSKYYGYYESGFTVSTTNTATRLRERRKKLITMRARIERKESFEPIKFEGGEITIEADRVIISHESKPALEVIQALKSRGFRWSPRFGSWSRKHTAQAIYDAKAIVGVK